MIKWGRKFKHLVMGSRNHVAAAPALPAPPAQGVNAHYDNWCGQNGYNRNDPRCYAEFNTLMANLQQLPGM